jgi:hypothetical protein
VRFDSHFLEKQNMESEKQKTMRASIRSIQQDTTLTAQQKARYIQQVMMGTYNPNAVAEEQKAKESIVLDVAVTYHNVCFVAMPICLSCKYLPLGRREGLWMQALH